MSQREKEIVLDDEKKKCSVLGLNFLAGLASLWNAKYVIISRGVENV